MCANQLSEPRECNANSLTAPRHAVAADFMFSRVCEASTRSAATQAGSNDAHCGGVIGPR
jgi:hypothetical protein